MKLKDLRDFIKETKNLDDDVPVLVSVPTTSYISETPSGREDELLDEFIAVEASVIVHEEADHHDDHPQGWVQLTVLDPDFLRLLYGEEYKPQQ